MDLGERSAVHVFHNHEVIVANLSQVIGLGDVSVDQLDREFGLVDERGDELLIRRQVRKNLFDAHGLLDPVDIVGQPLEDLGHAPLGDLFHEVVLTSGP